MTVFRVGTMAQSEFARNRILDLQAQVFQQNAQISSGNRAQRYSGIATDSKRLVSLEASLVKINNFVATNNRVDDRLQVMEAQSSSLFDIASSFRVTMLQALSGGNEDELDLVNQAQGLLDQVAGILNVQDDGQYLFGGGRMDIPPVDLTDSLFTAPPAVYPSVPSVLLDAGTNAQSLATQGMTLAFDETVVTSGDGYRLSYDFTDAVTANLTLTNTVTGTSTTVNIAPQLNAITGVPGANLAPGQTAAIAFPGLGATVTLDSNFVRNADNITTGTLDAAAIGSITTASLTVTNRTSAVGLTAIQALMALDPTVYDPDTGLMTIQVANDGTTVEFSAAGVDLGDGVGVGTTDRVGTGSANVVVGGHHLATIDYNTLATTGAGAGSFTIDVGNLLFGQKTPAYYQGDNQELSVRADENTQVNYGVRADAKGFENLVRALHLVATNPSLDIPRLEEAQRLLTEAIDDIPNIISRIGLDRSNLEKINVKHEDTILLTEETVGEIKFVDVAEALIGLQANQTALEASFSVVVRMGQLSILNFL
ncbi:MAG: flagellin [Alphaproteobacteria bacterium]|nr:flagellin [Alphaproteobacteria bacterium]